MTLKGLDPDVLLRDFEEGELNSAPGCHSLESADCPLVPRLSKALEAGWTDNKVEHVRRCTFCQRSVAIFWKLQPPGILTLAQSRAGVLPYRDAARIRIYEDRRIDWRFALRAFAVEALATLIVSKTSLKELRGRLMRLLRFTGPVGWAVVAAAAAIATLTTVVVIQSPFDRKSPPLRANEDDQEPLVSRAVPHVPETTRRDRMPAPASALPGRPTETELADVELRLRYLLFERGWDVGEGFSIGREEGHVILSGTASDARRAEHIRAAFADSPQIRISIQEPEPGRSVSLPTSDSPEPSVGEPLLKKAFEENFQSPETRQEFVKGLLKASDDAVVHAFALKSLADRYVESEIRLLSEDRRQQLNEMVLTHAARIEGANRGLDELIRVLPSSRKPVVPMPASDWRDLADRILAEAKAQDRVVAALTVSSTTNLNDVTAAAQSFVEAHESLKRLIPGMLAATKSQQVTVRTGDDAKEVDRP